MSPNFESTLESISLLKGIRLLIHQPMQSLQLTQFYILQTERGQYFGQSSSSSSAIKTPHLLLGEQLKGPVDSSKVITGKI